MVLYNGKLVVIKNENLHMQLWNDLPKYILTWKKICCVFLCVWRGICRSAKGRYRHRKLQKHRKKLSSGAASRKEDKGLWQKENILHWIWYCTYAFNKKHHQQRHQFLCAGQEITICVSTKWMLQAKHVVNGWIPFFIILN